MIRDELDDRRQLWKAIDKVPIHRRPALLKWACTRCVHPAISNPATLDTATVYAELVFLATHFGLHLPEVEAAIQRNLR